MIYNIKIYLPKVIANFKKKRLIIYFNQITYEINALFSIVFGSKSALNIINLKHLKTSSK